MRMLILAWALCWFTAAPTLSVCPNPEATPGVINKAVDATRLDKTICSPGWTKTVRPSVAYTNRIKVMLLNRAGIPVTKENKAAFELDHLVSLELGGDPADVRNLWLEPWTLQVDGEDLGAHTKDKVENYLHREVCAHRMALIEAQYEIAHDWVAVYRSMK